MKKFCFIFCICLVTTFNGAVFSQESNTNASILDATFSTYKYETPKSRKFLSLKNKSVLVKINPLTYVGGGLLFFYQSVLSQQLQASCKYVISCSNYTKFSIEKFGLIKGMLMGSEQFINCTQGAHNNHEDYKITLSGKINNSDD